MPASSDEQAIGYLQQITVSEMTLVDGIFEDSRNFLKFISLYNRLK